MVKQPTIDIIIPNYNKAKYLNQCLDSILSQTYKSWNIYLVDDNSKDNSKEILQNYQNFDNINLFFLKENRGPSYCRNLGIEKSSSEFIAFIDAGCYVSETWLWVYNSTAFGSVLSRQRRRFNQLYKRRAMLHHYTEFVDAAYVGEADEVVAKVLADYEEIEAGRPPLSSPVPPDYSVDSLMPLF